MTNSSDGNSVVTCGCGLLILIVNLIVGTWSVNYILMFFLAKTIPTIGALLIGLVAGEITIPVALVIWLLRSFGIL